MRTPFLFGKVAMGETFTDRERERSRLVANFSNGVHTTLISPRRWGKSSLVRAAAAQLTRKDKHTRFCFIDLFNIRSEDDFYQAYAKETIKCTTNKAEEWVAIGRQFLRKLSPKFSMGIDDSHDIELSFEAKAGTDDFRELLDLPERVAKSKGLNMVVCIDEFQNLSNFKDPGLFQKRLRAAWQHHRHVTYCLYGSKRHMLMQLFEDRSMPFYRFGEVMYLEKIAKPDLVKFIIERFESTNRSISENFAAEITDLMECHPYYVQQLSHIVWTNITRTVNREVMDLSISDLLSQNAIVYQKETDDLSNTQVAFLQALADGINAQLSSQEVMQKYKLGTSANVIKIREALDKKEIIDVIGKKTFFMDPAFALWFKRVYNC